MVTAQTSLFQNDEAVSEWGRPRLLVSVRSTLEACRAIAGGADVLDIKEPSRGSLGMADPTVIEQIARELSKSHPSIPLSVALGELQDWEGRGEIPLLPDGVTFSKLGLSHAALSSDWKERWRRLRQEFDARRNRPLSWVAVAYADAGRAGSPSLESILQGAIDTGCRGLLIDTWCKSSGTLFDCLTLLELQCLRNGCRQAGLFFAVAGRVSSDGLSLLHSVEPDLIAIRSAACARGDRCDTIDSARVASFLAAMSRPSTPTTCGGITMPMTIQE